MTDATRPRADEHPWLAETPARRDALVDALFQGTPDGVVGVARDGTILFANERAEELFGYEGGALTGQSVESLVPLEARERHHASRDAYRESPYARPMGSGLALQGRRADGSEFPIAVSLIPMRNAEGAVTVAIVRDLREQVRASEELARAHAELRDLYEQAPCGYHSLDADGRYTKVNDTELAWLGVPRERVIGRLATEFLPADAVPVFQRFYAELAARGHVEGLELELLFQGERRHCLISATALYDAEGAFASSRMSVVDITERRRVEQKLERTKDELLLANRELETFSYSVAHDLRAPLRAIGGFASLLLEDLGDTSDEARSHLDRIRANAERMGELIDALLALGRLSRAELNVTSIDLSELARDVGESMRERHPRSTVDFAVEDDLHTAGDVRLLRALLENLLDNAWKFTSKREHASIRVRSVDAHGVGLERVRAGFALFEVRDDGAGFDMAHASKLFAPFQRLHRASEFEGTGVGLATADRIVRRHGGSIWLESKPGAGTSVFFSLPLPSVPSDEVARLGTAS
jgi:PAS domain S-box-containing protein